jgi:glutamate--cysteine ligase
MSGGSGGLESPRRRALRDEMYARCFAPAAAGAGRGIGAEVELLTVAEGSTRPAPLFGSPHALVPALRRLAPHLGWTERAGYDGMPRFDAGADAVVSFEPGGQLEVSSAPCASVHELLALLERVVTPLGALLRDEGIALYALGIDPMNDARDIAMQLPVERYEQMTRHFERIGPYGIRMMRQTAAIQVSLDRGEHPEARWHLLNALAPFVIATFANSRTYRGADTGHQSFRAHCWRELDPSRTGIAAPAADPAGAYVAFALGATDLLHGEPGAAEPFGASLDRGPVHDLETRWTSHLTTLFPEVRPRGHFEVRSCDALQPEWYAAPLVFLAGIAYDERASAEAARLIAAIDDASANRIALASSRDALLRRAGEHGLRDAEIARTARDLFQLALDGAARLGDSYVGGAALERARAFYEGYTAHDRSPADDRQSNDRAPSLLTAAMTSS